MSNFQNVQLPGGHILPNELQQAIDKFFLFHDSKEIDDNLFTMLQNSLSREDQEFTPNAIAVTLQVYHSLKNLVVQLEGFQTDNTKRLWNN